MASSEMESPLKIGFKEYVGGIVYHHHLNNMPLPMTK